MQTVRGSIRPDGAMQTPMVRMPKVLQRGVTDFLAAKCATEVIMPVE